MSNVFKDSAIIITLVTVYLYCASTDYLYGYYESLRLEEDVLDRNFHQILFEGGSPCF